MSNQQSYKNQVVHLNLYKGTEILKKQDGTISNERQTVKLFHGSVNWVNFLKNIKAMGFGIAMVGKVVEQETTVFEQEEGKKAIPNKVTYKDIETPAEITAEVVKAMETNKAPELTADQKRIAELEAKLEAFMAGGKSEAPKTAEPNELEATELLLAARQKYMDLSGKQGDSRWGLNTLNEKNAELEAAKA